MRRQGRKQGIRLALLAAVVAAVAMAPAAANGAQHDVYIDGTSWDPPTLQLVPGDVANWAVNRTRESVFETGHDLWVCTGEDTEFEPVDCVYDTGDPEAVPPANYIAHRPYCGWYEGIPVDECEDGLPSDLPVTFDDPGKFTYYCQVHPPMRGALTVATPKPQMRFSISPKRKTLKKGKTVKFKVKVQNQGDGAATSVKVCASGPKSKVKLPKCKNLSTIGAGNTKTASMKVRVKKSKKAKGKAKIKFKITVGNAPNKTLTGTVKIKK